MNPIRKVVNLSYNSDTNSSFFKIKLKSKWSLTKQNKINVFKKKSAWSQWNATMVAVDSHSKFLTWPFNLRWFGTSWEEGSVLSPSPRTQTEGGERRGLFNRPNDQVKRRILDGLWTSGTCRSWIAVDITAEATLLLDFGFKVSIPHPEFAC